MPERRWLLVIMLALAAWGAFHAFGAYYQYRPAGVPHNPWRAVVVLACSGGFLAFWGLLLAQRRARVSRNASRAARPPDAS